MPKRTLVTTSDERSWPEIDEKILFLGSWCIKHNQEHILKEYDFMVMEPFGISLKEKSRNNQFISSLINEITFELANELNKYHGTNYSIRYWNILFGHWLQRHIKVIFNRYKLIELSLKKKEIDRTIRMCSENFSFIPTDTLNAVEKFSDDEWNHNLFILLLNYFA